MIAHAMRAFVVAVLVALLACAHSPDRLERYRALSQPAKDAYDRYHQFFTELQVERYLAAPSDEGRQKFVAGLHIEERLARYPKYVQDAIWSRDVVPGMDREAVLLSFGRPDSVDRSDDARARGVDDEMWYFKRGGNGDVRVRIIQGVVTTVERP
jgi:hypothetical protein